MLGIKMSTRAARGSCAGSVCGIDWLRRRLPSSVQEEAAHDGQVRERRLGTLTASYGGDGKGGRRAVAPRDNTIPFLSEVVQGPCPRETLPILQCETETSRSSGVPIRRYIVRCLYVIGAQWTGCSHAGTYRRLPRPQPGPAGLVLPRYPALQCMGRCTPCGLASRQFSASCSPVPKEERGDRQGLSGLGAPPGLPPVCHLAAEAPLLRRPQCWNLCFVPRGHRGARQVGCSSVTTGTHSFSNFIPQ